MAKTFVMELQGQFTENGVFFSRKLAMVVSDLLKRESGRTLTPKQLDGLSGYAALRAERRAYHADQFADVDLRSRKENPVRQTIDFASYTEVKVEKVDGCESLAWGGLEFLATNQIEGMKVRLGSLKGSLSPPPGEWLIVDVQDPLTLRRAQRGLRESWKGAPHPGIYFGQGPCGMIEFYSKGRTIVVHLNGEFHIQYGSETDNGFVSWTLAKVLNDVILQSTGKGMTKSDFGHLAGGHPDFDIPELDD